jgi:hypothetical protein
MRTLISILWLFRTGEWSAIDQLCLELGSKARCLDHEAAQKLVHDENMVDDFTRSLKLRERSSFKMLDFSAGKVFLLRTAHIRVNLPNS